MATGWTYAGGEKNEFAVKTFAQLNDPDQIGAYNACIKRKCSLLYFGGLVDTHG